MKKNVPSPLSSKPKPSEILVKIAAAKKRADATKRAAQAEKVEFKRVRKSYKQAKKTAKAARRLLKELKKDLVAAKAAIARSKVAVRKKITKKTRRSPAPAPEQSLTDTTPPMPTSVGELSSQTPSPA